MQKTEHLPEGFIAGSFKILKKLGEGGSGTVYLAKQMSMDKIAAVKILHPEMAENPEYVRNFIREARTAAKLDHPHIIQALDVGSSGNLCYFAMEYVNGVSLEQIRVKNPSRITPEFLLDLSISLADALDYAWKHFRIIHGDIKPDNLMIRSKDNALKLADLGLANVAGSSDPGDEVMATPLYASPEVIMGKSAGVSSDIYSFGIMLYELLSGNAPFNGNMEEVLQQHLDRVAPPLEEINPGLPPALSRLTEKMMAKAPADRPAGWDAVKKELLEIRRTLPDTLVTVQELARNDRGAVSHSRLGIVLILGIFLFCLLLGFFFFKLLPPLD